MNQAKKEAPVLTEAEIADAIWVAQVFLDGKTDSLSDASVRKIAQALVRLATRGERQG